MPIFGLPFQVTWQPTDQWRFQASYMLIQTIHVKAQYRFSEHLCAFAAYDFSNEAYSLLDRPEENDRFFIYDQRVSLGLQASLWRHWTASVSGGYVFDRYMFEGTSFSATSSNRVNLGAGPVRRNEPGRAVLTLAPGAIEQRAQEAAGGVVLQRGQLVGACRWR